MTVQQQFPPLPEIGRPDVYYTHAIEVAQQESDIHRCASLKVGRYITLGINPLIPWRDKNRYFVHAIKHHCVPPSEDEAVRNYYNQLADLVREHAGAEALRIASAEDDNYAARLALQQPRAEIENDAEVFFGHLLGTSDHCPDYFTECDWQQLKLLRDQWI